MTLTITVFGVTDLTARCLDVLASRTDCAVERLVIPTGQSVHNSITTALARATVRHDIEIVQEDELANFSGALGISVGYPSILTAGTIAAFERGIVNVHLAPLPRYRGSLRTLSAAILSGDPNFGVTLHEMDSGIDTGPILRVREVHIPAYATAADMLPLLLDEAYRLFLDSLDELIAGTLTPVAQSELAESRFELVTRKTFDHLLDIEVPVSAVELDARRRALTWSPEVRPRLRTSDGVEIDVRRLAGRFDPNRSRPPAAPLSSALLGETDRYFDPVWQVEVTLSPLEQGLLAQPALRRLAHIAHAGAASLLSVQTYSRLEHSLGLLALVSHLRPEDEIMRLAALVHDIGHLPLSHTLERALGASHHALGDAKVRSLHSLLSGHGVDAQDIIDAIAGRGPSSLGRSDGTMRLDHFESYVRSAQVHGTTWETPHETLESIELLGASISCDAETANYLFALMIGEAERQSHPHNVRANAVTGWLAQRAAEFGGAKAISEISEMIDRDLWTWLDSVPETREPTRDFLLQPERWSVRAAEADARRSGALLYEIPRFYLDPPLIDGACGAWPPGARSEVACLPRHFLIDAPLPH